MSDSLYVLWKRPLVFLDFETTGVEPTQCRAIELAGVRHDRDGRHQFHSLINPGCAVPTQVQRLTGISTEALVGAPDTATALNNLQEYLANAPVLIAHNGHLRPYRAALGAAAVRRSPVAGRFHLHPFPGPPSWGRGCPPSTGRASHTLATNSAM